MTHFRLVSERKQIVITFLVGQRRNAERGNKL